MYKLVVIDLDDTLLNNNQKISENNKKAISMVQKKGIEIMIATGRMYSSTKPYLKELSLDNEVIVYNGSLVKDIKSDKTIYHKPVSINLARKIIMDAKMMNVHINLYMDDKLYVDQDNEYKRRYEKISGIKAILVKDLLKHLDQEPTKLLVIEDDIDTLNRFKEKLINKYNNRLEVTKSKSYYIEIGAKSVNKGKTLKHILDKKEINPNQIIAIGDSYNDIEMLSYAKTSVVVDNAPQDIKEKVDFITPNHNYDGVALILDKLIFN
ncbi:MAG: Cof-type HAD-IIB family hydrolase [Halanaerobiales bacterium]|nr:Cof-type HAD-IIB family hydrolase [Halanaerobiales bacterium]